MNLPRQPRLGRLSGAARFARVLALKPCARSDHFAVFHHVEAKLSTGPAPAAPPPVDGDAALPQPRAAAFRLGLVVPKRFARRAVTRNLIKRQMREAVRERADGLAAGDWVLRLRAPVALPGETAAAPGGLAQRVRGELAGLLAQALKRCGGPRAAAPAGAAPALPPAA